MKTEWASEPLGDLFNIGAGKTMSAAARNGSNMVPFLRTSNVFWDRLDLSKVDEMSISEAELPGKLLKAGDLLICEGGEIGRAAIWDGSVERIAFQNHLHRLRPRTDDVDPRFYVYFLQAAFTQLGIFEGVGNKTTIPNLSSNRLAALDVPHPPLSVQKGVVKALGTVRKAIDVHETTTAIAGELKRAVASELFARGVSGEAQKDTEIGLIPENWDVRRLDAIADVISTRMSYSELESISVSNSSDVLPVMGIKVSDMNLWGNELELVHSALMDQVDRVIAENRCAPPGTIVFPKRGAAIATNKKRIAGAWTAFDPNIIGVRARAELDRDFLFQWFLTFDLRTITEPGPTPQLNKKNLVPLLVPVPPTIEEQQRVARILGELDRKIDVHRRKRALMDELFRFLLHQLMTGAVSIDQLDLQSLPTDFTASEESSG
jgi:type I restriction enzyme S subunit